MKKRISHHNLDFIFPRIEKSSFINQQKCEFNLVLQTWVKVDADPSGETLFNCLYRYSDCHYINLSLSRDQMYQINKVRNNHVNFVKDSLIHFNLFVQEVKTNALIPIDTKQNDITGVNYIKILR